MCPTNELRHVTKHKIKKEKITTSSVSKLLSIYKNWFNKTVTNTFLLYYELPGD